MKWFSVLQLMRPANIITAIADILAGIAIAGIAALAHYLSKDDDKEGSA